MHCYRDLLHTEKFERSIGTLGGGNHFLELDKDGDNNIYLVIHSGSRNLGKQVADFYQKLAIELRSGREQYYIDRESLIADYKAKGHHDQIAGALKDLEKKFKTTQPDYPKELCFLTGQFRDRYLHDMFICQEYATLNRFTMAEIILGWYNDSHVDDFKYFQTIHNYINPTDNTIRKGAISARAGERCLIPMNMRDGSLLCIGKGNPDWNYSAPHGAGRIMSRSAAKSALKIDDFIETMKDVYSTTVKQATIDEAPMAYKPMQEIIDNIGDTVEVQKIIKPIYNFKASD
jgi:RNA-splicing ligase RtcB